MPKIGDRVLPKDYSGWSMAGKGTIISGGDGRFIIRFDKPLSQTHRSHFNSPTGTNNGFFHEDNFIVIKNERTFGAWARKMEGKV